MTKGDYMDFGQQQGQYDAGEQFVTNVLGAEMNFDQTTNNPGGWFDAFGKLITFMIKSGRR